MSKERQGYEFRKYARKAIDRKTEKKCVVTGSKKSTQRHHMLPIWLAKEAVPYHRKEIIRSGHNGTTLRSDIHTELHEEMRNWPEWAQVNFAIGLYAYLEEEYYKNSLPGFAPPEVGNRQLTTNVAKDKEIVIYEYASAGD